VGFDVWAQPRARAMYRGLPVLYIALHAVEVDHQAGRIKLV
jgi:hypothetical protein